MSALDQSTSYGCTCGFSTSSESAWHTHADSHVPTQPSGGVAVNVSVDYEKQSLRIQVQSLISYIAELRKHLHHHRVCLGAKNRNHTRSGDECDMCRAELDDLDRLLAMHYKSGLVE